MDGSSCSALKGSGSNQDPKRPDGSSRSASDGSAGHVTPFEESLRSTIRDQETSRERPRSANNTQKKAEAAHPDSNQAQKLKGASLRERQTPEKTKVADSPENGPAQIQQPGAPVFTNQTDPALVSPALINTPAVIDIPVNAPAISDVSPPASVGSESTPQAINKVAGLSQVEPDSETKAPADQETLVFDAALHSAAPAPARPPQAPMPGTGKPAWLLNSQPVYAAREDSTKVVANSNQLPPNAGDTSQPAAAPPVAPQQIVPQNTAAASVQPADKTSASNTQTKPEVNPGQTDHVQPASLQPISQTGSQQSSSDNMPGFHKDPNHAPAEPAAAHQPEPSAQAPHVFETSGAGPAKVDATAPSNTAAPGLSKSGVLPIYQQAETRQPSMKTDLTMRIQGQSGENINVRISERAGDIQISVRSSDQGTANILKHELPSIEAGLERAGWRMETSGMSQSGQDQQEAGRDSRNPDRNREQNSQEQPNWQDRNQRRRDSSPNSWFEMDQ
jgi:hypothetical protein